MTDDAPQKRPRRRRSTSADAKQSRSRQQQAAQPGPAASPGDADPDAALQRLESMGAPAGGAGQAPPRRAAAPAAPAGSESPRPVGSAVKAPRARPRPAAAPAPARIVARIAAPVVFLIAVIAFIGIAAQSGVIGGADPTPTPSATQTKGGSAKAVTKKYTVKSGDSLTSIAERFDTSVNKLEELNPDLAASTLVVGDKILVPTQ